MTSVDETLCGKPFIPSHEQVFFYLIHLRLLYYDRSLFTNYFFGEYFLNR